MRDDELLPQTPPDVIAALGFDPCEIDDAAETACAITPGSAPNATMWSRSKGLARRVSESVPSAEWALVLESSEPWDESKVKRDGEGQFAEKGGGESLRPSNPPDTRAEWRATTMGWAKRLQAELPKKLQGILEEYAGKTYSAQEIAKQMDVINPTWSVTETFQIANKINVARTVGARLEKRQEVSSMALNAFARDLEDRGLAKSKHPTKTAAENAVDVVLGIWSDSSSDGRPDSQALQAAVADVMGVTGHYDPIGNAMPYPIPTEIVFLRQDLDNDRDALENSAETDAERERLRAKIAAQEQQLAEQERTFFSGYRQSIQADRDEILAKHGPVLRAIAQEIYANTQDELKSLGVDELVLFRGMALEPESPLLQVGEEVQSGTGSIYRETYPYRVARSVPLRMQPISSFSASLRTAGAFMFGERGQSHAVIAVRVPRERIFSTCISGMGCLAEAEVIVLHHDEARGSVVMSEYDDINRDKARRLGDPDTFWGLLRNAETPPPNPVAAESAAEPGDDFVLDLDATDANADWIGRGADRLDWKDVLGADVAPPPDEPLII